LIRAYQKRDFLSTHSIFWETIPVGSIVCPAPYQPKEKSFWEKVAGVIEDVVDFVSDLYNKLTDFIVDLAAKLNPLCAQAKLVADPNDVDKVCKFVAKLAVEAGKAYLGLPPSLPNYDDLTNLGKDYVVKVAAEQLESTGVPCPKECQDLIRKGIDLSLEQIKQSQNNASCFGEDEAHSKGIEPLCAPEGVVTKPDPKGQQIPGMVQLQVTRKQIGRASCRERVS
jgi:hypothetical protein